MANEELNEELDEGTRLARALADQLRTLGASKATILVEHKGEHFIVTVEYEGTLDPIHDN